MTPWQNSREPLPDDAALGVPGAWFREVLPPAGVVCTHPTESVCEAPQSADPPGMTYVDMRDKSEDTVLVKPLPESPF